MKNIVFMGTGPFALSALKRLFEEYKNKSRISVFTKADKRSGRGMKVTKGAVSLFAEENGLPLYQPETLRREVSGDTFLSLKPDIVIVASYGLLLPEYVINYPKYGCINIHGSLLPKYRGAAPINRAVMDGEKVTGVTIMKMDKGLDTGDMLRKSSIEISPSDTAGSVFEKLALLGSDMLIKILPDIEKGNITPEKQNDAESTYASKITPEDRIIDWSLASEKVTDIIRGLSPIPSAVTKNITKDYSMKIILAENVPGDFSGVPGQIIETHKRVLVKAGAGAVSLVTVQPEGKTKMSASDAVNGRKFSVGDILG